MNYKIDIKMEIRGLNIKDVNSPDNINALKLLKKNFFELNMFLGKQEEKVAYYYEDLKTGSVLSYNSDILFYAASSIKILVCLLLLERVEEGTINLQDKLLIKMEDLKHDTGIIKFQKKDTYYTLEDLIRLTIVESDNTAYIKLVNYVGKEELISYGKSLGALHTLEGKDLFGLINCDDMVVYWKKVKQFIEKSVYGKKFHEWLSNASFKIVQDDSIGNNNFVRKYGSWEIAYHEAGYVDAANPFIMIILTQKNRCNKKKYFVNQVAKKIYKFHELINSKRD